MPRSDFESSGSTEAVLPSAARTATGTSSTFRDFGAAKTLRAQLEVTAVSGVAPTLDVVLEDTLDGTNFNTVGTFTQATAATRQVINITTPFSDRVRARYTLAGTTPSFTFSVVVYSES